ncbi:hypothetical protein DVH05_000350 [Phytophthora capsici]|nr:hypothetical protein DVH05_000350 [Phytophthora capsici]
MDCIPESESVQLLDLFLNDMDELDASQSNTTECDPKLQIDAKTNEALNNRQTRVFGPRVHRNVATAVTARKKKHSWQRRKEELHRLRQETQAMETRVVFLRLQRQNRQTSCGFQQKWKGVIATEQQQLKRAQQENSELKEKARAYKQLLDALQAAVTGVRQVASIIRPANPIQAAIEESVVLRIDSESARTFSTLETIVDHRFQDLQSILNNFHLKSTAVDDVEVHIFNGDGGTKTSMEYKCVQVLPFDNVVASEAVWNLVGVCNRQKLSQVVRRSENTYSTRSRIKLHLDQDTMLFAHVCTVIKRHAVREGIVMLGESSTNWSAFRGDSKLWSHESRESGLFTVRRFPLEAGVSTDSKTCQGCQFSAQVYSEATKLENSGIPSTHAIVLPLYRELLDAQRQFLENQLWDSVRTATN